MKTEKKLKMVKPAEEQLVLQKHYIRIIVLIHDIDANGRLFGQAAEIQDIPECFRLLKTSFISYSVLLDSLKSLCVYGKDNEDLKNVVGNLRPKLEFMNHLRNKISGHLDDRVIDCAIQWQPTIFTNEIFEDEKVHLAISYYGLLESAINSYLDKDDKQKYFGHNIDVCYPPDWDEFLQFMSKTALESLEYLERLKSIISPQLELVETREDLIGKAIWAGQTDFKLKKTNR